ncbi:MAG: S-methyl-5-thioribose-1-phosphate isomerase [Sedimentisphaerales bacterium]|nr:S-methyl-5-thioribose-1-phosphate isomerase [Sedimentisphaerales bacterium]
MNIKTIEWTGGIDGHVRLIDQTLLPGRCAVLSVRDVEAMWEAIKVLRVRGAPAIGIAAAFGLVLGMQQIDDAATITQAQQKLQQLSDYLAGSRPTAVNLFWALERMLKVAKKTDTENTAQLKQKLLDEAQAIRDEDAAMCRAIGKHGAGLIKEGSTVLTHCNAGGLATAEFGTALAVMFTAHEQGKKFRVFADETRPLLQGARLTTWELMQAGIDVTLICDNMAGHLMSRGEIDLVITGADRIAANGDAANKIGTYSVAVLAAAHGIPFYIAAPSSTFDLSIPDGQQIPIEQRDRQEVINFGAQPVAPENVQVYNPAFDVTPAKYLAGIITERGLIDHPSSDSIRQMLQ